MPSRKDRIAEAAFKAFFAAWVALWLAFLARELVVKNNIRDYAALLSRDIEGKHAYVTGDKLYAFLDYCKNNIPENGTYSITGMEEGSIERRRAVYYLYPRMESSDPGFIVDISEYALKKAKE
ncbi:MAG: hypothetical protein JXB40_04555 [Candidatus Omnitrophica bacterium]|nr:hypothetical protein [Candidatus Omnitrophota bacterium]